MRNNELEEIGVFLQKREEKQQSGKKFLPLEPQIVRKKAAKLLINLNCLDRSDKCRHLQISLFCAKQFAQLRIA